MQLFRAAVKSFLLITFSVVISSSILTGQAREDFIWLVGYNPNLPGQNVGGAMIDFAKATIDPEYFDIGISSGGRSVINNKDGNLLVYTDGCKIVGADHQIIFNGDSINYGGPWESFCGELAYPVAQGLLLLPMPDDPQKIVLFHLKVHDTYAGMDLLYSVVDLNLDGGKGAVVVKNKFILEIDVTDYLTAVKHANGRDWWVLLPRTKGNDIYRMLLTPNGFSEPVAQNIGSLWDLGSFCCGQATFSPDGTKYARYNPWKGVDIFDFDRCTGILSNPVEIPPLTDPIANAAGIAFSPGSRFLYASNSTVIYQYDMWAADIENSGVLIAEYDGFVSPFPTNFYQAALTPDHRIFLSSSSTVTTMHVIEQPDIKGLGAGVRQHSFSLPVHNAWSLPNFPHYRLGPEDGSTCDTLGIDNVPVADFIWVRDSLDPSKIRFKNTSYFEPTQFEWTFGDGDGSDEKDPIHDFSETGIFEVCLSVSNGNGSDMHCRDIDVMLTSATHPPGQTVVRLSPNPFSAEIYLNFGSPNLTKRHLEIYNVTGQLMYRDELAPAIQNYMIDLHYLPPGGYYYLIRDDSSDVIRGVIVKVGEN